jgi:hypothetical protein
MNRQRNKSENKYEGIETMLYRIAELNISNGIAVLTYIGIVVLNCCRTVVCNYRHIAAHKQQINVVDNSLSNDLQQNINNYLHH